MGSSEEKGSKRIVIRKSNKELDLTLFMLGRAIEGVYTDPAENVLVIKFTNEPKALEFINSDFGNGPVYYFYIQGRRGDSPFFDKYRKRVSNYALKEGSAVTLFDKGKVFPYNRLSGIPNPEFIDIFKEETGIYLRLKIRHVKETEAGKI